MAGMWKSVTGLFRPKSLIREFRASVRRMDEEIRADCLGQMHKPTNFQKKTLVWAKMYKTLDEVPERVTTMKLRKAQDICRIYGTCLLMVSGAVSSLGVILYSRHLRNTGQDSIHLRHQLQVAKWKADAEMEQRQKAAAAAPAAAASVAAAQK